MKKAVYWIGIYAICAFIHDFANEALPPLLHKLKKDMNKKKEENNRSINMTTGKVGEPLARIGF